MCCVNRMQGKVGNEFFEGVTEFRELGTTQTNRNGVHEDIKKHIESGECHFVPCMTHCLCIKVRK